LAVGLGYPQDWVLACQKENGEWKYIEMGQGLSNWQEIRHASHLASRSVALLLREPENACFEVGAVRASSVPRLLSDDIANGAQGSNGDDIGF
jgi:hypothetical protein